MLGTVQLGLPYGRRRADGVLPLGEARAILDRAWSLGIRAFDTAEAYGEAAPRLADWLRATRRLDSVEVVTKVAVSSSQHASAVHAACKRFTGVRCVDVLTHGAAAQPAWRTFQAHAYAAGASPGQSVYTPDEVRRAAAAGAKRVQAPGNVLDNESIQAARTSGVSLDVRSVYLQGVFLETPDLAERRAPGLGGVVARIRAAAEDVGLRPAVALLAALVHQLRDGERVVIGVDDPAQLGDVAAALESDAVPVREFAERTAAAAAGMDRACFDPRTWPA